MIIEKINNTLTNTNSVFIYDGSCLYCNTFVNYIFSNDRDQIFRFMTLNSLSRMNNLLFENIPKESSVLIIDDKMYVFSDCIIMTFLVLKKHETIMRIVRLIPEMIRDKIYKIIAKYRYLIGLNRKCNIPPHGFKERIISN